MLLNDVTRNDKMNGVHTRDLQNAVVRHHRNNPHVSLEAAFEYIMLNSATFRALPIECIEKARKYLDLPIVGIKPKEVTSECKPSLFFTQDEITPIGWKCNELPTLDIRVELESMGIPSSDEVKIKTKVSSPQVEFSPTYPGSKSMVRPKPKPSTTVVHAERVVVDNKKVIKILKFNNVYSANKVPVDYLKEPPYYIRERDISTEYILLTPSDDLLDNTVIKEGDIMSLKEFGHMIKTMKEAGVRLSKINKTAKLEKEHSGEFTVSI